MLVCSADFRRHISIHALREESDRSRAAVCRFVIEFLSTLSVRRATPQIRARPLSAAISIHALREESDPVKRRNHIRNCISIHALREESDALHTIDQLCLVVISIHALREESDGSEAAADTADSISIHALREESDGRFTPPKSAQKLFLSTLSVRRAT